MHKSDLKKDIFKKLDKILTDFAEILVICGDTENDLSSLFSVKRRSLSLLKSVYEIDFCLDNLHEIYKEETKNRNLLFSDNTKVFKNLLNNMN